MYLKYKASQSQTYKSIQEIKFTNYFGDILAEKIKLRLCKSGQNLYIRFTDIY
jgi:hypothetical protein